MSTRPAFTTVSDYLSALTPAQAKALKRVLASAEIGAAQHARDQLRHSRIQAGTCLPLLRGLRRHIGLYPPVRDDARLQAALAPYANAKGNLSFPLDEPLPMALIGRVGRRWRSSTPAAASRGRNARRGSQPVVRWAFADPGARKPSQTPCAGSAAG